MQIVDISFALTFRKQFSKLSLSVCLLAQEKTLIFKNNPFDARLKTHKLHGMEKESWAFSLNYSYRIKFKFLGNGEVLFVEIGKHDIYR